MSAKKRPSKVILIVLDTLRVDHLGCYGYARKTSPNIDRLTSDSILFKYAFSPCSYTLPSHASIFTGKSPSKHSTGFSNGFPVLPLDHDLFLAEILSDIGYETAGFVSCIVLSKKNGGGVKSGFKVYDDTMIGAEQNRPEFLIRAGKETNEAVLKWLNANFAKDFFLFINYFDIHGPYVNPEPYASLFVDDAFYYKPYYFDAIASDNHPVGGIPEYQVLRPSRDEKGRLIDFERDLNYYIAQYDGGVRYADDCLGELIDKLKSLGIYDDSLIILTSDHGEAMGENNIFFFHGLTVTPDQIHVPLIIKPHHKWETVSSAIDIHVGLTDIAPTILDLTGIDYSKMGFEGASLVESLMHGDDVELRKRMLFAEIEGQIANIDKETIKVRKRQISKEKSVFCHIEELCGKEMTVFYRAGKEHISEHGKCFICGNEVDFPIEKGFSLRETRCPICLGTKRSRDLAKVIAKSYLKGETLSLSESLSGLKELVIYEAGASGPIHDYLNKLPKYTCSEYLPGVSLGSLNGSGVRCEDLEGLTFPDNSFDLVITQDVFEHVMDPEKAFKEIERVLKPGGYHIFTIPFHEGRKTVRRIKREDTEYVFTLPQVYHSDPLRESGSLVYTDFGEDIIEHLNSLGMPTEIALHDRFYTEDLIPWIADELSYATYTDYRKKGEILKYFLYNSVVIKSTKRKSATMLNMDGERFLPWMEDAIINYEHLHRYRFAKEFVKGKRVLDLACGEGYGSFMLSEEAMEVIGVDIDALTIRHASSTYIRQNLEFIQGSIINVPLKEEKIFDVIVCFEALEHIREHDKLMDMVKRLLKDEGVFIVSTPNRYIYSDKDDFHNPFHLKELYFDEFKTLLKNNFKNTLIYGQKVYPSSNIFPLFGRLGEAGDYAIEKSDKSFLFVPAERKEARYFIAISSDCSIKDGPGNSYLVDVSALLFKNKDTHIRSLEEIVREEERYNENLGAALREKSVQIENFETAIKEFETAIKEKDTHIVNLERQRDDWQASEKNLRAIIAERQAQIEFIYSGHGWGLLAKYFKIRNRILPQGSRRGRLAKFIWNLIIHLNIQNLREFPFYIKGYVVSVYSRKTADRTQKEKGVSINGANYENAYELWIRREEPSENELEIQRKTKFPYEPTISIIVPTLNMPEQFLRHQIESVLNQTYSNWEFCTANGGSNHQVNEILREYAKEDKRVKIQAPEKNQGIAPKSHEALSLASGEYICPLLPDIELAPFAFYEIAHLLDGRRGGDFVYFDHDSISLDGKRRFDPQFKPDWSPDTLRSWNYIGSFFAFKRDLIKETPFAHNAGNFDQSGVYDLILNVTEKAETIYHIPKILYHKRHSISPGLFTGPVRMYSDGGEYKNSFLKIQDNNATPNRSRFKFSFVILSKDKPEFIIPLLDLLLKGDINLKYEVIVGDTGTTDRKTLAYLHQVESQIKIIKGIEYHFAQNYNLIIRQYAGGEIIGILNNDMILRNMSFLDEIERVFNENIDSVGAVGAKLVYPDGRLQHGGVFFKEDRDTNRGMPYHRQHGASPGVLGDMKIQNVPAVTGAFMFVNRKDFIALNGFDERYRVEAQDIDFCLKCRRMGKEILFVNIDGITHVENGTRPKGNENPDDREYFLWKWRSFLNAAVLGTELNREVKN